MQLTPALFLAVSAVSFTTTAACATAGSGISRVDPRPSRDFQSVRMRGSLDATITVGADYKVAVDCDDNLLPLIRTEVRLGVLVVEQAEGGLNPRGRCAVDITMPKLTALDKHGSGNVAVSGNVERLERVMVTGSGSVKVDDAAGERIILASTGSGGLEIRRLAADEVALDLHGSGGVTLGGKTKSMRVRSSGSGRINARELASVDATVDSSGSSDVAIHATNRAVVNTSGSGDVRVAGNPPERVGHASGSASIRYE